MNDFRDIESELKKLRPAPLRPELAARLEQALVREQAAPVSAGVLPSARSRRMNWLSLGLGVSLAGAAAVLLYTRSDETAVTPERAPQFAQATPVVRQPADQPDRTPFYPAGATQVVYRTRDEGVRFPDGAARPVRMMRYDTRETMRWRNPATGASLRVSYPSEETVFIPVTGH